MGTMIPADDEIAGGDGNGPSAPRPWLWIRWVLLTPILAYLGVLLLYAIKPFRYV